MNALTFPILRLLADGKFHSGEDLAQQFKVTRATIWNAVNHAETLGIEVFSVRGRGYKLPQAIEFLDENEVLKAIGEQRAWFKLEVLDEVASTNTILMQSKHAAHATCVAAHVQTSGKGRRGRTWVSHLGSSLTFSLLWRFQCGAAALSGLSLAVGVALMRTLHGFGINQAQLKWPNDVLIDSKKLAGILIELQGDMEGPSAAVIGVGVNLNLPKNVLHNIDQPAIDLASTSVPIDQNELLGVLLKHLADVLSGFEQQGFIGLRDEWLSHHAYHGKPVRMHLPDGRDVQGVVKSVAEDGILLVETALGLQRFSAGEISLRGV
ncbi:MAG TPA: biotin--[acetyl-CoA-carboxylase] ligase [Methylotenera sp.]|nr:biotin--[acetyl-CoA-carboxylase] ligase [Methylotenera sp.]HPV45390.1 biotin--[acetyl-CoA-carboxylase] ligase [Methylotenera sp.]